MFGKRGPNNAGAVTLSPDTGCALARAAYHRLMVTFGKPAVQMFDVYANKADPTLRIATASGARLPAHLKAKEWSLMPAGSSPLHTDARRDVGVNGYCFFQVTKGK